MLRSVAALLLFAAAVVAQPIFPAKFGPYKNVPPYKTLAEPFVGATVLREYGVEDFEVAHYEGAGRKFSVAAWRFTDPTGAAAAFDAARPAGARRTRVSLLSAEYPNGSLVVFGNYLLKIDGWQPDAGQLVDLAKALPSVRRGELPALRGYLPARNRIPGSERYVLGPASLSAFEPRIPAAAASFDLSAEAALARYRVAGGEATVAVFSFPTPHIARDRLAAFQAIPGAQVKRTGPLVAVGFGGADRVLGSINYAPEFTWTERVPKDENVGIMIMAIIKLAGILLVACLGFGLLFGFGRMYAAKRGWVDSEATVIALDLNRK